MKTFATIAILAYCTTSALAAPVPTKDNPINVIRSPVLENPYRPIGISGPYTSHSSFPSSSFQEEEDNGRTSQTISTNDLLDYTDFDPGFSLRCLDQTDLQCNKKRDAEPQGFATFLRGAKLGVQIYKGGDILVHQLGKIFKRKRDVETTSEGVDTGSNIFRRFDFFNNEGYHDHPGPPLHVVGGSGKFNNKKRDADPLLDLGAVNGLPIVGSALSGKGSSGQSTAELVSQLTSLGSSTSAQEEKLDDTTAKTNVDPAQQNHEHETILKNVPVVGGLTKNLPVVGSVDKLPVVGNVPVLGNVLSSRQATES